jgi:hypothetical protein
MTGLFAGLAGLLAGVAVALRGGFDGLGLARNQVLLGTVLAALLVGMAIVGAFVAWAEKHALAHPAVLLPVGLLLPLAAFGLLLLLTWRGPALLTEPGLGRTLGGLTAAAVVAGLLTTGAGLQAWWGKSVRDHASALEHQRVEQAEEARREALGAEGRLLEDLEKFSPTAPLWTLIAGLPDEGNAALRAIWIARALQVPHLDTEVKGCLASQYGIYRHGCAAFIRELPPEHPVRAAWAPWLAQDARLTAADIRKHGNLHSHEDDALGAHVIAIAQAAARLPAHAELSQALTELRAAVQASPDTPDSAAALAAVDAQLQRG